MQSPFRPAALTIAVGAAIAGAALWSAPPASAAGATVIDFEKQPNGKPLPHGAKLYSGFPYKASNDVTISAANSYVDAPDLLAIFDTRQRNTRDPDLEFPYTGGGNLATVNLGNIGIIPENNVDANKDGILDLPDDLGRRPAGQVRFLFNKPINSFGFDVVDMELREAELPSQLIFQKKTGTNKYTEVGRISFKEFKTPTSKYYDPTIKFGDHTANRIKPITAAQLGKGVTQFDRVLFNLGGSGGLDNVTFTFVGAVPEPATGLAALAGAALLFPRRRRA